MFEFFFIIPLDRFFSGVSVREAKCMFWAVTVIDLYPAGLGSF